MLTIDPIKLKRPYEAVVMMDSICSEDDQKALFKKNKEIIESFGGEVNHLDTWGPRRLANPIGKKTKALFFHTTFTAETAVVAELERTMKINVNVLRYMHTRLNEKVTLTKYMDDFKEALAETLRKEKEREAKFKARRAMKPASR